MKLTRRTLWGTVAVGLAFVAATAFAQDSYRAPEPRSLYRVALEDASGGTLPTFWYQGQRFVLGEQGERYSIRVDNPTGQRVEAVVSVDGRDAISGRVGDYRNQRGYIIPPYGSVTIDGFRRSLDEVASFRFSDPGSSYSARRGTPENVGVIGVAFFTERQRPRLLPPPIARREREPERRPPQMDDASARDAAPAPSPPRRKAADKSSGAGAGAERGAPGAASKPSAPVNNLGTEYGETRWSHVNEVSFERRSARPDSLVTLRYDDSDGLEARGIDVRPYRPAPPPREPEPFPNSRFAEPPP